MQSWLVGYDFGLILPFKITFSHSLCQLKRGGWFYRGILLLFNFYSEFWLYLSSSSGFSLRPGTRGQWPCRTSMRAYLSWTASRVWAADGHGRVRGPERWRLWSRFFLKAASNWRSSAHQIDKSYNSSFFSYLGYAAIFAFVDLHCFACS